MGKLILFIIGDLIMGAEYCNIMINDPELKMTDKEIKVFAQGVIEQAEYDHGHSGYSGSFAEKEGVTILRDEVFMDEAAADKFLDDLDTNKWEYADAVPVAGVGWYMAGWCSA
jgi:hypothetical protein